MKRNIIAVALSLSLSTIALAGTTSGNLKTVAQLTGACSFSATPVNFGVWNPNGNINYSNSSSQKTSNNIRILCSNKLPFTIKGPHNIEKPNAVGQFLTGSTSSDQLVYNVYTNDSLSGWFADGLPQVNGTTTYITSAGTGIMQNIPLFFTLYSSAIYPKVWVRPDVYTDNYTLSLAY